MTHADTRRREESFQLSDKVLLSAKNINLDTQARRPSKKLQPRYIGPYKVVEVISPVTYKLKLPSTLTIHPVFHVSLLKAYQENSEEFQDQIIKPSPPLITFDGQEEFEVEKILDQRTSRKGQRSTVQYLVKWKGYSDYDTTWKPIGNLQNARDAIQHYEEMISHYF